MRIKIRKRIWYKVLITVVVFWFLDFILHNMGVGESNYYYSLKFVNSFIFAFIWFTIFDIKKSLNKFYFSIVFGTWVSFSYLISSYSGLVQFFGISARYNPPPFIIFGLTFTPILWWVFHILLFYLGLEASRIIDRKSE
ncbi:MAG: hypothetical protein QXD05_01000 [Candidatus Pacearchaeota archaeon]